MKFRNFKMIGYVVYGRGSFDQLDEILEPHRRKDLPMVFLVDHFFSRQQTTTGRCLTDRLPVRGNDKIIFADTSNEPRTVDVDRIARELKEAHSTISGIVGIGGGSTMDLAKGISLMMNNPGSSADYQGWDLVKFPGVYKVGIPTLSGTGAEVSRTAVLNGPSKKLGLNSDYSSFDQVILDPDLTAGVPPDQRFYTGMDCYIHCIESLEGTFLNGFSKSYGETALGLCREVFLNPGNWNNDCDEKLMMASYAGGMSIAYSQVGIAHAVSYGLSYQLGIRHGIGNCIVMNQLGEYYPAGVKEFRLMVEKNNIMIPTGVCREVSDADLESMINVSLAMKPLWENALGKNWETIMTKGKLRSLYQRL